MSIIGFVGWIGSGKGTASDIFVDKYSYNKLSFAGPVKDACSSIFGWDRDLLEGDTQTSREWREESDQYWSKVLGYDFSPRKALQLIGTESGRNVFHKDIWVFSALAKCKTNRNYVISDCRFPNEIYKIRDMGGKVYWIRRGELPHWYQEALEINQKTNFDGSIQKLQSSDIHYSEWAWIGCEMDGIIENDGDLKDLEIKLAKTFD